MAELTIRPGTRMMAAMEVPVGQTPEFNMMCTFAKQVDDIAFLISVPMVNGQRAEFDNMQKFLFRYENGSEYMIIAGFADDMVKEGFRTYWKIRRVGNQRQFAQRQDARYKIAVRLNYLSETWPLNADGVIEPSEGFTMDISAGGLAMFLSNRFEVGEVIKVNLPRIGTEADGAEIDDIAGVVCWEREAPKGSIYKFICGIQYRFGDPSEKEHMKLYVENARKVFKL